MAVGERVSADDAGIVRLKWTGAKYIFEQVAMGSVRLAPREESKWPRRAQTLLLQRGKDYRAERTSPLAIFPENDHERESRKAGRV
ncbi:MAG TPA: hypothetical protein VGO40_04170, partial [Longimicrobium sp.]|nr:hypothetical protein [Longimicrobium sp.]